MQPQTYRTSLPLFLPVPFATPPPVAYTRTVVVSLVTGAEIEFYEPVNPGVIAPVAGVVVSPDTW